MFENIGHFFKRMVKTEQQKELGSKDEAKERLHLVLMQDRANVSADFLELMKQEIIDVIRKYIVVDEEAIDVRLTNQSNEDGTNGAPSLYANIPIVNIKNDMMAEKIKDFEGVDFNKEMGIPVKEDIEKDSETPKVIELSETYDPNKDFINNTEENKVIIEEKTEDTKDNEEVKEMFEEVDEDDDDDDITFDDLLKAAEAADDAKKEKEQEKEQDKEKDKDKEKEKTKTTNTKKTKQKKK